ncbi:MULTISPECIES: glutathione S-transferase [unclassified Pseudomonas]|uniref:glutathione S-transferase n=1 Tax=unclassified Pseudomonas TaxID=196821 RepID=UPI000C87676C|nr:MULTISPECIES: glutathione S-transferase [unclassified Pseudomonas]PMU11112.1 glutathione S-transferase [Pseudomonas sp. FW305-20]PMU21860.1 glutathione S-transferase [Pseudomonas sp. FW305-122]PMU43941.1 glutathione S-transferase [Pseudomonas sp. FW305-47B]PMX61127.1 glutathione S-transferase [Pseudomonas sp. FW305-33]PMX71050.1 glutathione S-transferase [Pseudomonas sp. FW305-60]
MNTLYSFRRCPYAMRARMALRYAGVAVNIVEVSLKAKPAEMLALSSKGTVPVLSVDGQVIDESLAIMNWALAQNDPQDWLLKDDPVGQQLITELIEENDQVFKVHLNRYKYAERYPEQPMTVYRAEGEVFLRRLDELLEGRDYLLAEHPSLADVALMPFVRQFAHVDREWFGQSPYRRLQAWLQRFLESELFTDVMRK